MKSIFCWARRLLWLAMAMQACGAVPFYDGFDAAPTYGSGTNFLTSINGWASDSPNVQVATNVVDTVPNSVRLVGQAALSNSAVGGVGGQVWTECRVNPVFGTPPDLPAPGTVSLMTYFTLDR